jgi:hypothetical protein
LQSYGEFMWWVPDEKTVNLDGHFSLEELEAIAWWIRNKSEPDSGISQAGGVE